MQVFTMISTGPFKTNAETYLASVSVLKDRLVSGHQTMPSEDGYNTEYSSFLLSHSLALGHSTAAGVSHQIPCPCYCTSWSPEF